MMVNIGDVSGGQNRHITAGLEYGDSAYIWVGQASLTTKATLKTMSVSVITITHSELGKIAEYFEFLGRFQAF